VSKKIVKKVSKKSSKKGPKNRQKKGPKAPKKGRCGTPKIYGAPTVQWGHQKSLVFPTGYLWGDFGVRGN